METKFYGGVVGVKMHPMPAKIVSMELCQHEREKYGIPVTEAHDIDKNRLVVSLDNGHWAYGEQLSLINHKEEV